VLNRLSIHGVCQPWQGRASCDQTRWRGCKESNKAFSANLEKIELHLIKLVELGGKNCKGKCLSQPYMNRQSSSLDLAVEIVSEGF
jgi:hypothetical protein